MTADFMKFFKDSDYSKARFMSVASELLEQGRSPHMTFLAMYRAALAASIEHSIGEHYKLINVMHRDLSEYKPELEKELDRMLSDNKN